jgi:hypothetical protein
MSSVGGPYIVTDGLVLSYDAANIKSFRGEPSINLIPNPVDWSDGWIRYYRTITESTFTTEFNTIGYRFTYQPSWNGIYKNFNLVNAGIYTFSARFRYLGGSNNNNGATVYISNYGGGDTVVGLDKSKIGVWQRVSHTINVTSPSNVLFFLISYGGVDSGTVDPDWSSWEVTKPQIEPKPYATNFLKGSRGTTVLNSGGVINQSKINPNNGTISNPFASPEEAQRFGYPAGNYYFKSGSMSSAQLMEYVPNYYEGKPFCCVFRSPYRSTATTNLIDLSIPMGGLLVQRDTLDLRAAVYWSAPITYNTIDGVGNNTANSGNSSRRVILGYGGGHGIYNPEQSRCSWGNIATGAIGAGWDGSTCGSFPNDLVWGTGRSDTAVYDNRSGIWSHWITWTDFNASGELVNGVNFSRDNQGSFLFDGVDDTINLNFDLRISWSFECWVKHNTVSSFTFLGQGGFATSQGLHIWFYDNTSLKFGMYSNDLDILNLVTTTNTWYHYVFTYNNNSPFTKQVYRNGVLLSGVNVGGPDQYLGTGVVRIGSIYSSGGPYANGSFSGIKLYNKVLSGDEVLQNYNATKSRFE